MVTLDVNPFDTTDVDFDAEFESFTEPNESTRPAASPVTSTFQCDKCTYGCQSEELFDRHVTRHSTDRPFECTLCDYSVPDHSKFVSHLVFHQQSKVIQCPFCPYESYAATMKRHMLKHRAVEVFDCSACEFSSNNPKSMTRHTEVYHSSLFKCEHCKPPTLTRMTKHSMIQHWDEAHGIGEVSTANEACWNPGLSKPGCSSSLCPPEVVVESEYAQEDGTTSLHVRGLTGIPSSGEFVTGGFADDEIERTHNCTVCEFSSPLRVLLKYHILSMHTVKVPCKHCSAVMTKHALIHHSKNAHGIYIYFNGKGLQKASSQSETRISTLSQSTNYPESETHFKELEVPAKILRSGDQFICSICKYSSPNRFFIDDHIDKLHCRKFFCNNCPAVMTKHALVQHAMVKHGVTLNLRNRYLVAAQPGTYSHPILKTDTEDAKHLEEDPAASESNKRSEEDFEQDDAWPLTTPVDVARYIVRKRGRLFCSICNYSVTHRSKLERHIESVHVKKYHCKHCPVIMSRYDLIEHSMTVHGMSMSVKSRGLKAVGEDVDETSQSMDDQGSDTGCENDCCETLNHGGTHDERSYITGGIKPFVCPACGFSSHSEWSLTCHLKIMHTVKYHCNHCSAVMTKYDIIKHSLDEHGVEIRPRGPSGLREATDSGSQDVQHSGTEDKVFDTDYFVGHFMDDTENNSSSNVRNAAVKTNNPVSCTVCPFTAKSNCHVIKHMNMFHRKKYVCPHCPKIMTKHELIDHGWRAHGVAIKSKNRFLKEVAQDSGSSDSEGNVDHSDREDSDCREEQPPKGQTVPAQNRPTKTACSFCDYTSPSSCKVQVHVENMHVIKYQCEHCSVVMSKYDLIQHYKTKHGVVINNRAYKFKKAAEVGDGHCLENPTVKTEPVQESAPGPSEFLNKNDSSSLRKGCSFCGYKSLVPKDVKAHIERMHRVKFHCDRCPAVMVKYDLLRHIKLKHGVALPNNYRLSQAINVVGEESEGQEETVQLDKDNLEDVLSFQGNSTNNKACSFCGYIGKSRYHVAVHTERMHTKKFRCERCTAVMTKYDLIQHYNNLHGVTVNPKGVGLHFVEASTAEASGNHEPASSVFTGEHDPAKETDLDSYENPMQKDSGFKVDGSGEAFKCELCVFSSPLRKSILIHVMTMHRKKYSCNDCSAVLSKYELILHSKDVHGVEIPRDGRGYVFKQVIEEGSNELSEAGKSCVLSSNSETFERNSEQTSAMLPNVLGADGTSMYKCPDCEFTTRYSFNLKVHVENRHTKLFRCDRCSAFMNKHELVRHYENEHNILLHNKARFREYLQTENAGSGGVNTESSEANPPKDRHNPVEVERDLANVDNDESEFIDSVRGRPRSTLKPEIDGDQADDPEKFIRVEGNEVFRCSVCGFPSKYRQNLITHFIVRHKKKFRCDSCSAVMTKHDLIQHCNDTHNVSITKKGKGYCFKEVSDEQSEKHDDGCESAIEHDVWYDPANETRESVCIEQNGDEFNCLFCGWSSKYKNRVQSHVDTMHLKKYGCKDCSAVMSKYDLIQHYDSVHRIVIPNLGRGHTAESFLELGGVDADENILRMGDEFKCAKCDHSSQRKKSIRGHIESFHKKMYSCVRCSLTMTKYEMIQHYETDHDMVIEKSGRGPTGRFYKEVNHVSDGAEEPVEVPYSEDVSGGVMTDDNDGSMTIIRDGGEFKCSICGFSTAFRFNLKPHFECFHRKKYSCNRCSVVTTKYGIVCHYETVHRFVIPNFGKGNISSYCTAISDVPEDAVSSVFADGMVETVMDEPATAEIAGEDVKAVIEEGGRLKCAVCGQSSARKRSLLAHVEAVHRKKYSCNRCSLITTKYDMVQHYETAHGVAIGHFGKTHAYFTAVDAVSEIDPSLFLGEDDERKFFDGHWIAGTGGDARRTDFIQEGKEFKCSICGHTSNQKGNMKAHIDFSHKRKYSCNRCSVVLTKYEMFQHYETNHNVEIKKSGKGGEPQYFTELDSDEASGALDQSIIDSTATVELHGADENVAIIREGDLFKCTICCYCSYRKRNAGVHIYSHHKKMYSCNKCLAVMTKYEMVHHYKTDHGIVVPNQGLHLGGNGKYFRAVDRDPGDSNSSATACSEPENGGSGSAAVGGHSNAKNENDDVGFVFKDGREFRCSLCDFSTGAKGTAEKHLWALHKKKFSCNRCSVVMGKHEMLRHFEVDHGVEIPYNGRGFTVRYFKPIDGDSNASDLGNSEMAVTDPAVEVPGMNELKCALCDHSSKYKRNMRVHVENLHTKKFSCNYCSVVLTKHDMMHHCENEHGIVINKMAKFTQLQLVEASSDVDDLSSLEYRKPTVSADPAVETAFGSTESTIHPNDGDDLACGISEFSSPSSSDSPRPSEGSTVFHCSSCDFSSKLRMHMQVHTKNMHFTKHSCRLCSGMMTKHELLGHYRNVHDTVPSSTSVDPKGSDECDVSDAEAMQARNTFNCTVCSFSTKAKWYLKDHVVKFHRTKYHCSHCSAVLTKHALIKHCKNVHGLVYTSRQTFREAKDATSSVDEERGIHYRGASTSDVTSSVEPNTLKADQETADRAQCSKCDFSTPNKWYLKEHMESFHLKKYNCSNCSAVMSKHELVKHTKERHGVVLKRMGKLPSAFKPLRETAKSKYAVVPEFKIPKRFSCATCSFSSFQPFGLKRHVQTHHTIKYPCEYCSAVFTRHELIEHCRNAHNRRIPENDEDESKPGDVGGEPRIPHSDDHTYSIPQQVTTESQVVNPKFQAHLETPLKTIQSPAFQPVVALERLQIDAADLDSAFSIVDESTAVDSAMVKTPKFHDPPY